MASGSMLLDNHNLSTSTDSGAICVNECGRFADIKKLGIVPKIQVKFF